MKPLVLTLLTLTFLLPSLLPAAGKTEFTPQSEPDHWKDYPLDSLGGGGSKPKDLFDQANFPEIMLTFSPENYAKLLVDFDHLPTNEIMVPGSFSYASGEKKITLPQVGLRIRGNGFSRVRPEMDQSHEPGNTIWQRPHFRVSFDKYVPNQEFFGLESLNLKMYHVDPTYMRENYAMDLFKRFGVFTYTRMVHTQVYLHVEGDPKPAYLGVYRILETIDKDFVKDRFPTQAGGFLWKCLWPAPLSEANPERKMGVENPDQGKSYPYDLKTRKTELPAAKLQLLEFIKNLNTLEGPAFITWAQEKVNIELLLKSMAISNVLGVMDDYWANQNNYYLYFDDTGRVHYIPYDFDNIMGTAVAENPVVMNPFDANPSGEKRPLIEKFLAIPTYRKQYADYLRDLIEPTQNLFTWEASRERLEKWKTKIQSFIPNAEFPQQTLMDLPADWGKYSFIRLFSGSPEFSSQQNFFLGRTQAIRKALERE